MPKGLDHRCRPEWNAALVLIHPFHREGSQGLDRGSGSPQLSVLLCDPRHQCQEVRGAAQPRLWDLGSSWQRLSFLGVVPALSCPGQGRSLLPDLTQASTSPPPSCLLSAPLSHPGFHPLPYLSLSYVYVPDPAPGTFYTVFPAFHSTLAGHRRPFSSDEDPEAQRDLVTSSRAQLKKAQKPVLKTQGGFLD